MTGIHPIGHKVLNNGRPYREPFPTLAERLKRVGYSTAGFVTGAPIGKWSGIGRGFDIYGDPRELRTHKLPGTLITREAKRWLESAAGEPFFLFVHYFDVHPPYARGEGAVFPFEEDETLEALMEARGVRDLEMEEISDGLVTFEDAPVTLAEAINVYDNEIHHVDQMIGELLATLASIGSLEDTLLVVTSDHGEGLGEHGYYQHGLYLYEEQTHVPLIVRNHCEAWPARRVSTPVSLLDVAPALVEFLGLAWDERQHGRSLLPLLRGKESGEGETRWLLLRRRAFGPSYIRNHPRFASPDPLLALRGSEPLKLLESSPGKAELYDLDTDPHEARNRAAENDAHRRRLGAILHSLRQSYVTDAPEPTGPTDRETIEALEALGYLQ
jgi:arylsulfatase A-like enzyme